MCGNVRIPYIASQIDNNSCSTTSTATKWKKIFFHFKLRKKMGNYQFCFTCTKWCICFFTLSFSEAKEATHFAIIVMALVVNPFHFQNGTSSKESAYYLFLRMPSCTLHPPAFSTGGCHRSKLPLM